MKIDTTILAAQPFLKGLSKQQLEMMSNNAMEVEFPAGKMIFNEGLPAHRFYVILKGEVALESSASKKVGKPDLIQTIKAGDVMGWSWLFPPYRWNFDARAVKPTKAIIFFATTLREQCEKDPRLGYELMKRVANVVIRRLQATRVQALKKKKTKVVAAKV
ncbi:MAG: Crp/Fnr family transcriptional regulator [Verrucomicrobiae bacterium]